MSKTMKKQRYQPASQFDEATLAFKREYWRIKKREQRARLSVGKKKSRTSKTANCNPASFTNGPILPHSGFGQTLISNGASCQVDTIQNITKCEINSLSIEETNVEASMAKVDKALLSKCLPGRKAQKTPHISQTPNVQKAFNVSPSFIAQQSAVSQPAPRCNTIKKTQIKVSLPPSSFTFIDCLQEKKNTHTNKKASAYLAERGKSTNKAMSEEEIIAKRRENWRLKKREQRAKRAQKLKTANQRLQVMDKRQIGTKKLYCVAPSHVLPVDRIASRGAKQHSSVLSTDVRKPAQRRVKVEICNPPLHKEPLQKQQANYMKVNSIRSPVKNLPPVSTNYNLQNLRQNNNSIPSGISAQHLRVSHVNHQLKKQQQKFVQMKKQQSVQSINTAETAEERLAKRREYWRIVKRQQRAKHSLALKGQLKDRDAFSWRAKCYQNIMEQIRRTPTGFKKDVYQNKRVCVNSSFSGFIKEDGTVSTSAEKCPPTSANKSSYRARPLMAQPQELVQKSTRPVYSHSDKLNLSVNIHQQLVDQNISATDSLVRSKAASVGAQVFKSLAKEPSRNGLRDCKSLVNSYDSSAVPAKEPVYPSINSVFSLTEKNQVTDTKDVSTSCSPPKIKREAEPNSIGESQSTTLLVVASMKKLLEESLTSMDDSRSAVSEDKLLPCKSEDVTCTKQAEERNNKPDPEERPKDFPEKIYSAEEVKPSLSFCPNSQTHDISSAATLFSCPDPSLEQSCSIVTDSYVTLCPVEERSDLPVVITENSVFQSNSTHGVKTVSIQQGYPPQCANIHQVNESSELQKKREYWRLMKRQQRARKAKEMAGNKSAAQPRQLAQWKGVQPQVHNSVARAMNHSNPISHVMQPIVSSRPQRVVLSPTMTDNQKPLNEARQLLHVGKLGKNKCSEVSRVNQQQMELHPSAPTSSTKIHLTAETQIKNVKVSDLVHTTRPSIPKSPNTKKDRSEIDPDEIIKRRRMLWRIKKQEQRARKAAQEKELRQQRTQLRTNISNGITELAQSTTSEILEHHLEQDQGAFIKIDMSLLDEGISNKPLSEAEWRNTYLMDYDCVNQLLVCMVCGEQQYSFSVKAVRAHIEESHPNTFSLEEVERQRILQDWDELVTVRERFFTNHLWQNNESHKDPSSIPEVEVTLEADDQVTKTKKV